MKTVVLFTKENSIYNRLGCDCYDKERNALTYTGQRPVIAHPPCRAWGKLKGQAKPEPGEKNLAVWALQQVNQKGGCLEHPKASDLFKNYDISHGILYPIQQKDFGHPARKDTYIYIVGLDIRDIPPPDIRLGLPDGKVENQSKGGRESTPERMATWLIEIIRRIET
jgi:hypothetical protein